MIGEWGAVVVLLMFIAVGLVMPGSQHAEGAKGGPAAAHAVTAGH
jgi:hypothetical protein